MGTDPAMPVIFDNQTIHSGMPIRLELAARFVAAMLTQEKIPLPDKAAGIGLLYADVLIEQYNKQNGNDQQ